MQLEFKEITIRNFLSFGNVPQTLPLNDKLYQVIVGLNKDKSNSDIDRNGVGKSTIFEAIHYALFGKSIGNKVTLGNLINNINKKNMVVSLKFKKDDTDYEIIRGRSPNILKFIKNGQDKETDESQGDSRETQQDIEKVIGMNEDLYNQIVCLSCKVPVFLDQTTSNQKNIIEKILGIDIISEKIDALKNLIKETKNSLNNEEFKYQTIDAQNKNLIASIEKLKLEHQQAKNNWYQDINNKIQQTNMELSELNKIDIDQEMENFKLLEKYLELEGVNKQNQQLKDSLSDELKKCENNINYDIEELKKYQNIDFEKEKEILEFNELQQKKKLEYQSAEVEHKMNVQKLQLAQKEFQNLTAEINSNKNILETTNPSACPTCGQPIDKNRYNIWKNDIENKINKLQDECHQVDMQILDLNNIVSSFKQEAFNFKESKYSTLSQLLNDENNLQKIISDLETNENRKQNILKDIDKIVIVEIGEKPKVCYNTYDEIMNHTLKIKTLKSNLEVLQQQLTTNPFEQQEKSIIELENNIQPLDDSNIKKLNDDLEHQNLLLKLLNNPNSFIRQAILDTSLEFLNNKIIQYLEELGSMHVVTFNNDMSISIKLMDVEYGYVSSGEMGRISTALTLAFRDAWESLNNCSINLLAMDEVIDRIGLDTAGVEMMVECLKKKKDKNILLVTHNEHLINQSPCTLTLIKENGFTDIQK